MYSVQLPGCLILLLIVLAGVFLVKKLWMLFVGFAAIMIAIYYFNLIMNMYKEKQKEKAAAYEPKHGEVYKVCPYCNSMVKVSADTCPNCNRELN